jgi:4-amino-4-deoxy-L-arabinose transferase-like glycosyltransferase
MLATDRGRLASHDAPSGAARTLVLARRGLLLLSILVLAIGVGIFDHDLWAPTEPTVAGVVTGMFRGEGLAVPRIHGLAYLEKPPLYYWAAWLCATIRGELAAGVLRLPSALFGLGSLLAVAWTARRFHGEAIAWAVALLGATTYSLCEVFHRACTDAAATFGAFAAFSAFAASLHPDVARDPRRVRRADVVFAAVLALSFYAKNFYTFLVVLPPVVAFLVVKGEPRRIGRLALLCTLALAVAVLPWCVALYRTGGADSLRTVFLRNTFGRFLDLRGHVPGRLAALDDAIAAEKGHSSLDYLGAVFYLPLPWTPLFVAAFVRAFVARKDGDLQRFLRIAVLAIPIALLLSTSRVPNYLLPILWPALMLVAGWLAEIADGARAARTDRIVLASNVALAFLILASLPVAAHAEIGISVAVGIVAIVLGGGILVWFARRGPEGARFLGDSGAFLAFGYALVASLLVPAVDRDKSFRPFFEQIRPDLQDRRLATSLVDDMRLPLIDYYVGSSVEIVRTPEEADALLRGKDRAALFVHAKEVTAIENRLPDLHLRAIRGEQGKSPIALVLNR